MKTTTLLIALSLWVSASCLAAAASAVTRPQNTAAEALLSEGDGLRRQGTPAALRAAAGRYSQALEIFRASGLKERETFALGASASSTSSCARRRPKRAVSTRTRFTGPPSS